VTPASSLLDPSSNAELYTATVLHLYLDLPDTPLRASAQDHRLARCWFDSGVPLATVETAFLLASLRRLCRPPDIPPLSRVRSLAYYQPVVDELLENPVSGGYLEYLRVKLRSLRDKTGPAKVQKNTFSDDR
jgi:hypothetical protein